MLPDQSDLQARLFTDFETFFSNFLAVPAPPAVTVPRSVGRMTLNQTVPVTGVGGMVTWSKGLAGKHFFTAGGDWRWVEGESQEDALDAARGATVITQALRRRQPAKPGRVRPGRHHAGVEARRHPQRARSITGATTMRTFLETTVATGLPTANNRPSCTTSGGLPPTACRTATTPWSTRASRRSTT